MSVGGHHLAGRHHHDPWVAERSRRRRDAAGRVLRALVILGLEVAVALVIVSFIRDDSVATEPVAPVLPSADAVAADPAAYRSAEQRITGTVLEYPKKISKDDRGTFVLTGAEGAHLLVVPSGDEKIRAFRAGTPVVVRGTVVIPPSSKRLARRTTSRTAIAKRADAPALIKAVEVTFDG